MFKFDWQLVKSDIKKNILAFFLIVAFIVGCNVFLGKVCYFRAICGLPCAGCGLTRAFWLAGQFKFKEATIMHPFWIAIVLLFVVFVVFRYFVSDKHLSKKLLNGLMTAAIVVMILCIVYYIYRMIVWYPYVEPMVYDSENLVNHIKEILHK